MGNKRGRKSVYDTTILPNIDKIRKWVEGGGTEQNICDALGISVSAFNAHKDKKELKEALKKGRTILILDLRGDLAKRAVKHTLETKKQYIKHDLETGHKTQYTEITTKEVDGDTAATHLLLKNLDRENWKNDWDNYDLKQQEIEIRKMIAEIKVNEGNWEE